MPGARRGVSFAFKHVVDRMAAIGGLAATSPLLLLIAVAIKLDDGGPPFFRQQRLGLGGRRFRVWKFRTMRPDADRFLNDAGRVVGGNRITRVGRVLRLFSLDELPQLINVARGEMSLVGPRPALPEHLSRYTDEQRRRLLVRPGITGLAQIAGRNKVPWSLRIQHDLDYIDRWSLWLDVKILLATVGVVARREGLVLDRNPEEVDDLGASPASPPMDRSFGEDESG